MRTPLAVPTDLAVRLAAFRWLHEQAAIHGEVLSWPLLIAGFSFEGTRVPLVSMQGIFKPAVCRLPLSIRTAADGPYDDSSSDGGLILYKYRLTDPFHRDNVGLRQAMKERTPMVYLRGQVRGRYSAVWPVYIVGDSPGTLTFTVAADDSERAFDLEQSGADEVAEPRRAYVTASVRRRLHQQAFRERVLDAYSESCALCRLRHRELLDAAHIIPDRAPEGEPVVSNGLSMCKLHHAAFDGYFLTVDPDYRVRVSQKVLEEEDGPMLRHGLQELHGILIRTPRSPHLKPNRDFLAMRLESFSAR